MTRGVTRVRARTLKLGYSVLRGLNGDSGIEMVSIEEKQKARASATRRSHLEQFCLSVVHANQSAGFSNPCSVAALCEVTVAARRRRRYLKYSSGKARASGV